MNMPTTDRLELNEGTDDFLVGRYVLVVLMRISHKLASKFLNTLKTDFGLNSLTMLHMLHRRVIVQTLF